MYMLLHLLLLSCQPCKLDLFRQIQLPAGFPFPSSPTALAHHSGVVMCYQVDEHQLAASHSSDIAGDFYEVYQRYCLKHQTPGN